MIEVGVEQCQPMRNFKGDKMSPGARPLMIFIGSQFETHERYKHFKSMFMDLLRGREEHDLEFDAVENVVVVSSPDEHISLDAEVLPVIHVRVYMIQKLKSGQKLPRIELLEMGPRMDFSLRRSQEADPQMLKMALQRPKAESSHKRKNIDLDIMGDAMGRIHMGKQDLDKMALRKFDGLKRSRNVTSDGDEEDQDLEFETVDEENGEEEEQEDEEEDESGDEDMKGFSAEDE